MMVSKTCYLGARTIANAALVVDTDAIVLAVRDHVPV